MYPPVPTLTREAERSMELGGYHIEKGTMLGVAVFSMHNNPAYWKVLPRPTRLSAEMFRVTSAYTSPCAGFDCALVGFRMCASCVVTGSCKVPS